MITFIQTKQNTFVHKIMSCVMAFTFLSSMIAPTAAQAQMAPATVLNLPAPGTMVAPTSAYMPTMITGTSLYADNPLQFDFIVNPGESGLKGEAFKEESVRLIKYFLASMTVPDEDMWVNLSPYEKDRITSQALGETELGRDLLAQDYMLKQLSASLVYPEKELGKDFWKRVHTKARDQFGTDKIPVNTFNKVWIVPEYAKLYEHNGKVFILENRLKVMLDSDYFAMQNNRGSSLMVHGMDEPSAISYEQSEAVIRELIIPEIEREVNEGKTFANLRQIYNSMLLATWYKQNLKESLLGQVYADKAKTRGVDVQDKEIKEKIYAQYIQAFKRGVYNYIKEDVDPVTGNAIPRKYFSGGTAGFDKNSNIDTLEGDPASLSKQDKSMLGKKTVGSQIVKVATYDIGKEGNIEAARESAADQKSSKASDNAMLAVRQIDDIAPLNPESVLVAVDWNAPRDGDKITNDDRIKETVPTFTKLLNETSAKFLYVMTHSGRPEGKGYEEEYSMAPITQRAQELVSETVEGVRFVTLPYDLSEAEILIQEEKAKAEELKEEEKIAFVFQNIRFYEEERSSDLEVRVDFQKMLIKITEADFYVNEAMSKNHRGSQASMEMIRLFPEDHRAAGVDVAKKISMFVEVEKANQRPLVVVAGGAKFDKYKQLSETAENFTAEDTMIIVGALAYPWLVNEGVNVGKSLLPSKEKDIAVVEKGIAKIKQLRDKVGFKVIVTSDHSGMQITKRLVPRVDLSFADKVELGATDAALDVGQKTLSEIGAVVTALDGKGTVILNGGVGVFEEKESRKGTIEIMKLASQAAEQGSMVMAIGGDMNAAIKILLEEEKLELSDKILPISGGGVLFEILNKGVAALSPVAAVLKSDNVKQIDHAMLAQVESDAEKFLKDQAPEMLRQLDEVFQATPDLTSVLALASNKFSVLGFEHEKANRMGFISQALNWALDTPKGQAAVDQLLTEAKEIREKFDTVVFAGMGGSGLSVEKANTIFSEDGGTKIISVRTTDPTALKDVLDDVVANAGDNVREALEKLKIVVISKSGGTAETIGHLKYFLQIYGLYGIKPTDHVIIYTDLGSKMDWRQHIGYRFDEEGRKELQNLLEKIRPETRTIQLDKGTDIGGRNTAPLTNVFLLPTAILMGEQVRDILQKAREMMDVSAEKNVFLKMGAYLYLMAKEHGKDKVTFVVPQEIKDVFIWSEQLFEESLGKQGKGVTIVAEDDLTLDMLKTVEDNDRVFLRINLGEKETRKEFMDTVKAKGYPVFNIDLESKLDIGGLQMGLQMAVVTIGYLWDIVTIDQDPVEHYKIETKEIMGSLKEGEKVGIPQEWDQGTASYGKFIKQYYQPVLDAAENRLIFLFEMMDDRNIPIPPQVQKLIDYGFTTREAFIKEFKTDVLPGLEKGIITREKLEAKVAELGADMTNAPAIQAALYLIAEEGGALELADTYTFGRRSPELKGVLNEARKIFGRQFKIPTKDAEGPDFLHAYFVNMADGPDVRISTIILPDKVSQPDFYKKDPELMARIEAGEISADMFSFDENLLRAPAIGTVKGLTKIGRKSVLLTLSEGIDQLGDEGLAEIEQFYQDVDAYIFKARAAKAEAEIAEASAAYRKPVIGYNNKQEFTNVLEVDELLNGFAREYQNNPVASEQVGTVVAFQDGLLDFARQKIDQLVEAEMIPEGYLILAAENLNALGKGSFMGKGAFTGYPAAVETLVNLGVEAVILGHSELTTEDLGDPRVVESNEQVNEKVKAAMAGGLQVILAFGETADEKAKGRTEQSLNTQLNGRLDGVSGQAMLDNETVLAYEPVWAIGDARLRDATVEDADEGATFTREWLLLNRGFEASAKIPVEYGGSMNSGNVDQLSSLPNVDGGLIGSAGKKIETARPLIDSFAKNKDRAMLGLTKDTSEEMNMDNWVSPHGVALEDILNKVIKEYDIRGYDGGDDVKYPQELDDKLLRWMGRVLGSAEFTSDVHGKTVSLKSGDKFIIAGDNGPTTQKVKDAIIQGLRESGINVVDLGVVVSGELYSSIARNEAQGGLYVTRSHVEVGTNGAKPVIGGITLFGEMLQAMKPYISNSQYRKADQLGTLDYSKKTRQTITQEYRDFLKKEFSGLKAMLDVTPMEVGINLAGGSAVGYADLFGEILGDHLKEMIRAEDDPWNAQGGLADPSRDDDTALAHPKANILEISKQNPQRVYLNFDLDSDRVSVVWNGQLYKGDDMFIPVTEYQLTLDQYKELNKLLYVDSRMKKSVQQAAEYFGAEVKKHPKGHSKVKATMDVLFEELAAAENKTVEQFLSAHPGFRMVQPEYSLHMFSSNEKGVSIDDAIRFAFIWLEMFAQLKAKHNQPQWSLQDYLDNLEAKGIVDPVFQIKEQRTPMPDAAKKPIMRRMAEKVKAFFGGRIDFSSSEEWRTFEGGTPYVMVDVEGVFDFNTPIGHAFWGWSNTSEKVAIGMQSGSKENLKELSDIIVSMFVQSRREIAEELDLELPEINAKETAALLEFYEVKGPAEVESIALESKPEIFSSFSDQAILNDKKDPFGGIDLNPALLDMQIKRDGYGFPLPVSQQPIESFQIEGLIPVIINVTPAPSLPLLLGSEIEVENEELAQLSAK